MTTNQIPVQRCQYCGSDDLGLGWQHGEALVTYKKHGLLGSRLRYLICRRCGDRKSTRLNSVTVLWPSRMPSSA